MGEFFSFPIFVVFLLRAQGLRSTVRGFNKNQRTDSLFAFKIGLHVNEFLSCNELICGSVPINQLTEFENIWNTNASVGRALTIEKEILVKAVKGFDLHNA